MTVIEKQAATRMALMDGAEAAIRESGLDGLTIRKLADAARCSVGQVYKLYPSLDELVYAVNSRTLAAMEFSITRHLAAVDENDAEGVLAALAVAYTDFALDNKRLWQALFEQPLRSKGPVPQWHRAEHEALVARIGRPLQVIMADAGQPEIAAMTLTIFGAVHGVVALGIQEILVSVPRKALKLQVSNLTHALVRGLRPQN